MNSWNLKIKRIFSCLYFSLDVLSYSLVVPRGGKLTHYSKYTKLQRKQAHANVEMGQMLSAPWGLPRCSAVKKDSRHLCYKPPCFASPEPYSLCYCGPGSWNGPVRGLNLWPWRSEHRRFVIFVSLFGQLSRGCGWVCLRRRMYMWHIQHVISATVWASRSLIPPWHQRRCSWHHLARGDDDPSLVHWHPATWFTWTVTDCTSNLFQLRISGLLSEMHEMSVHERRDQLGRAPGLLGK